MNRFVLTGLAAFAVAALASSFALADTLVGVTSTNELVTFDSSSPSAILRRTAITGLQASENIVGIDFRPSDGRLYGFSNQSRIYTIDRTTGAASVVGPQFSPVLVGNDFGMDFNPVVDRIRLVSAADENYRVDPATGVVVGQDANLSYAPLDANVLANPSVVAVAYDRSAVGAVATTLFGIDSALDILVRQGDVNGTPTSPNTGFLNTIGPLGVDAGADTSFEIAGSSAFAAITLNAATSTGLYLVNLGTGAATLLDTIGGGQVIRGIAVAPVQFIGVTVDDEIITFPSNAPGTVSALVPIAGLQAGEHILAADVRPATGQLYGLGSTLRLYRIDASSGAATLVGSGPLALAAPLTGTEFGMDFNPVVDRIRIVSDANENLRVHPDTGIVTDGDGVATGVQPDAPLAFGAADAHVGADPSVVAAAYDLSLGAPSTTTLFGIDSVLDVLVRQGSPAGTPLSPNSGELSTIGPLGVDTSVTAGFDVAGSSNRAFAVLTAPAATTSQLYTVDLTTGAATLVGTIGGGKVIRSASAAPAIAPASLPTGQLFALTTANALFSFLASAPGVFGSPIQITGLAASEDIVGIDVRPSTGVLYGVSNQSRLYAINHVTGAATLVGTGEFAPAISGADFGVDFNPAVDRLRVVSDGDQNFRIDPNNGDIVGGQVDVALVFAAGDPHASANPNVVGLAYDRNVAVAPVATTAFGIDSGLDVLVRLGSVDGAPSSPNAGELTTIGPIGVDATGPMGFEITSDGTALAAITAGSSRLYTVNLTTGAATLVGELGTGAIVRGISIAPKADLPAPQALTVSKVAIKLDFIKTPKDSVSVSGTIPAFVGVLTGKPVVINVGGVSRTFVLDAKGKAKTADATFTLGKAKKGFSPYTLTIKKVDVSTQLADEELTSVAAKKAVRHVIVILTFDGITRVANVTLSYTASAKSGSASRAKVQ